MRFHPAKVPLKVFSISFKIHWACCDTLTSYQLRFFALQYSGYPEMFWPLKCLNLWRHFGPSIENILSLTYQPTLSTHARNLKGQAWSENPVSNNVYRHLLLWSFRLRGQFQRNYREKKIGADKKISIWSKTINIF